MLCKVSFELGMCDISQEHWNIVIFRMHCQTMQITSVLKIPVYRNIVFSEIRHFKNGDVVVTQISKARGFSERRHVRNITLSVFLLCAGTSCCSSFSFSVGSNSFELTWQVYLFQPQDLYAISYFSFWCLYLTDWFPICLVHLFIFGKMDLSCFCDSVEGVAKESDLDPLLHFSIVPWKSDYILQITVTSRR